VATDLREVFLKTQLKIARQVLLALQSLCRAEYAQFITEAPVDCEYRVITAVIPENAEGYSTAHRTGIIGQVFRTGKAIIATDAHDHPLYDTFDDSIEWELCFPLFRDGVLEGVINLEGAGELILDRGLWADILHVVEHETKCQPPALPPDGACHLVNTRRLLIKALADENQDSIPKLARAIASCGEDTLLVGDYPNLLRGRGPSLAEAVQRGLDVSYCFFGVEKRLDLLATGSNIGDQLRARPNWWDLCQGRYEFVLVQE